MKWLGRKDETPHSCLVVFLDKFLYNRHDAGPTVHSTDMHKSARIWFTLKLRPTEIALSSIQMERLSSR